MVNIRRTPSGNDRQIRMRGRRWWTSSRTLLICVIGGCCAGYFFVDQSMVRSASVHLRNASASSGHQAFQLLSPFELQASAADAFGSAHKHSSVHCKYHANCPIGTSCIAHTCLPYMGIDLEHKSDMATDVSQIHQILQEQQHHDACVQSCKRELVWDESYQYGSYPKVHRTMTARNGHGCVLNYERIRRSKKPPDAADDAEPVPPIARWIAQRQYRLIRVDPSPDGTWNALCDQPCEYASDCPDPNQDCAMPKKSGALLQAYDEDPLIPKSCYPQRQMHHYNDMVIVTGASSEYFSGLENFVSSAKYWGSEFQVVVYNLGMTAEQLATVRSWKHVYKLHWEDGIPERYPPHVHDLHTYAWKPLIVNETVHHYKSVFWMDAGATFTGPIHSIQTLLQRHGIFLVKGQDADMKTMSHPDTYSWFGKQSKDDFQDGLPHFAGGIQGHTYPSRYIDTIVVPNAKCALDPACIAPPGSNLQNHRYDQTSLSVLAYQQHVQPPGYTELLAANRDQLAADLRQPSQMLMWTSRNTCNYYTFLKLLQ